MGCLHLLLLWLEMWCHYATSCAGSTIVPCLESAFSSPGPAIKRKNFAEDWLRLVQKLSLSQP